MLMLVFVVLGLLAMFLPLLQVVLGKRANDGATNRPQNAVSSLMSTIPASRAASYSAKQAAVGFGTLGLGLGIGGAAVVRAVGAGIVLVVRVGAASVGVVGLRVVIRLGLVGVRETFRGVGALVVVLILVVVTVALEVLVVGP